VTRDDLTAYVYGRLPLRLRIAGRDTVGRIVDDAVRNWPAPVLRQCDAGKAQVVGSFLGSFLAKSLKRRQQQYGMGIILTLVLSALISEIVKILIRWWLDSRENRAAMQAMQETP
jgi:hypothetical protein